MYFIFFFFFKLNSGLVSDQISQSFKTFKSKKRKRKKRKSLNTTPY